MAECPDTLECQDGTASHLFSEVTFLFPRFEVLLETNLNYNGEKILKYSLVFLVKIKMTSKFQICSVLKLPEMKNFEMHGTWKMNDSGCSLTPGIYYVIKLKLVSWPGIFLILF